MKNIKDSTKDIIISIIVIIIIFWLWYIYGKWKEFFLQSESSYKFISPLLSCKQSRVLQDFRNINLKPWLQSLIEKKLLNSGVNHVSVYFEDLNNGYWFGLNEKEVFTPASLTKVPTLISVLKRSEVEQGFLWQNVKYSIPTIDYNVHYKPEYQVESDKTYTIKQLLEYMIKYSDNNATQILWKVLWQNRFAKTYTNLWINQSLFNQIEVIDYASFFRILFNSSYLNKKDSEYALQLLTQVNFKNWLVAWVPSDIKVAHKFWEYAFDWDLKQIHDCGIIYYPNHPYLLCVMTRWDTYPHLENIISSISKIIFENINKEYGSVKNK